MYADAVYRGDAAAACGEELGAGGAGPDLRRRTVVAGWVAKRGLGAPRGERAADAAAEIETNVGLKRVAIAVGQFEVVDIEEIGIADNIVVVLRIQFVMEDDRETRQCPGCGGE